MKHHPALTNIPCWQGLLPPGYVCDCVGSIMRRQFVDSLAKAPEAAGVRHVKSTLPSFDEEYFEWIDLLEAVRSAQEKFVMIELGAGFGRWIVRAAKALGLLNPLPYQFVAVEAEPTHFALLKQNLRDNGIEQASCKLVQGAVNATGEPVQFFVGDPIKWYGQAILEGPPPTRWQRFLLTMRELTGWEPQPRSPDVVETRWVPAITLNRILKPLGRVDLLDLDVQGAEFDVLASAIGRLDHQVKRVHVGTHNAAVESRLRELFTAHGWKLINDYGCLGASATPYSTIKSGDGVQSWVNQRL